MKVLKYIITGILATGGWLNSAAVMPGEVRWHNEATDTTRITEILVKAEKINSPNAQGRVGAIAREFLGTPYVAHTLEGDEEKVTVNVDELDCTTYVETVLALAATVGQNRSSWHDFLYNLENMRYRGGKVDGYSSRLHYISDWIVENGHRGNFTEVTNRLPHHEYLVKSLDYMSAHRDSYPSLKDSVEFVNIKNTERGYMSHRYPYVKSRNVATKEFLASLKDGDIVALTTKTPGLDVSHLGFIAIVDGVPHLMHASMAAGKVIIDPLPLTDYLKRARSLTGLRIIRLQD